MYSFFTSLQCKTKVYLGAGVVAGLLVFVFGFYFFFVESPKAFQPETVVSVVSGEGLSTIASKLEREHIISSSFWFKVLVTLQGKQHASIAGDYVFHKKTSLLGAVKRIVTGDFQLNLVKVTFPEGITVRKMADILATSSLRIFSKNTFIKDALPSEGYLFPDTYFIPDTATSSAITKQMRDNFDVQIKPLLKEISASGHTLNEIIIMASILEEEGKGEADQKIVSGILWKRISEGMFLQIDTPLTYENGRTSDDITLKDLQTNTPYNTYKRHGLPPTPISNPGLVAIEAAIHPTETPYYFFISDREGNMHYAKTGIEHQKNVDKYLR